MSKKYLTYDLIHCTVGSFMDTCDICFPKGSTNPSYCERDFEGESEEEIFIFYADEGFHFTNNSFSYSGCSEYILDVFYVRSSTNPREIVVDMYVTGCAYDPPDCPECTTNIKVEAFKDEGVYLITNELLHCHKVSGPDSISEGTTAVITYAPDDGYEFRVITEPTVTGADSSWYADVSVGELTLSNPTSDVVVSITAIEKTYGIGNDLTNCVKQSGPNTIGSQGTAELVYVANQGYQFTGEDPQVLNATLDSCVFDTDNKKAIVIISHPTGGVNIRLNASESIYDITYNLTHCTKSSGPDKIGSQGRETIIFARELGYWFYNPPIVTNANIYSWDNTLGKLTLSNATADVDVTLTATIRSYNIITNLSHCTGREGNPTTIKYGETKVLNFDAERGYELPETVTVENIGSFNWAITPNKREGTLRIINPTDAGDVIINVIAHPETEVALNLYQNSSEVNRVDKEQYLTQVGTLNGTFREECNIIAPSITIEYDIFPNFNYVYIVPFKRYYYVAGITSVHKTMWRIDLEIDILMSYKDGIKELPAFIDRNQYKYSPDIIDKQRVVYQGVDITEYTITNEFFTQGIGNEPRFLLTGFAVRTEVRG